MIAATAALVLSSCSKNEVVNEMPQVDNPDVIGLDIATGVTKADTETVDLQSGVTVSYYDGTAEANLTFACTDGVWADNAEGKKWVDLSIPGSTVNFYSMHDGSNAVNLTMTGNDAATAPAVSQTATAMPEVDYVHYAAAVSAVPAGGKLAATFSHATSKVNVAPKFAEGEAWLSMVTVKNFGVNGTATISVANTAQWSTPTSMTSAFPYLKAAAASKVSGTIINTGYIIPQTVTGPAVVADEINVDDLATLDYVEVVYRYEDAADKDIVGFENYADWKAAHPDQNITTTLADTDPLYIKVAFPLPANQVFASNTQYTLNLNIPGGYVIGKFYVDENGEETKVPLEPLEPGDPVVPSPNQYIGITVTVSPFGAVNSVEL